MAGSRETRFQQNIVEAMVIGGWGSWSERWERFCKANSQAPGTMVVQGAIPKGACTHYRLTKREEKRLRLKEAEGDYGLTPVSEVGSGKPHDPEKQRLVEIIDRLHFASGIAGRIERDEAVMAQVRNHSEDQVMHGLLPKKVTDGLLDALSDHEQLRT